MELSLKVISGRNAGQVIKVPVTKFIIGRSEDCHLRPHSDLVSRHHCAILIDNGTVAIRDFNSKNGTFVNGEKVVGQCDLKSGDKVAVGQLVFEVHAAHGSAIGHKPKVKGVHDVAARTATSTAPDEDTDVSRWLADDTSINSASDTKSSEELAKTRHVTAEELAHLRHNETNGAEDDTVASAVSDSKAGLTEGKSSIFKKTPGKLPQTPQSTTKDSREAAAEMLKKILRNR
jgi:pSer/pThr/pTyr-binding forkhead associated (FHA) protein